ncbi:MAG TPA: FAD/NAD(P)-binding oxidoreductase [Casimicrobiaceae bacterium]|nr:FAD/NAD(P)-binding oxidoreductase [Casimicrobiaceae bacterium]
MIRTTRRGWLRAGTAATLGAAFPRWARSAESAHVVVVGGGFGGATAAKYLRKESAGAVRVTLVEQETAFVSCPLSNLVVGGMRRIEELTVPYDGLERWGVRRIAGQAVDLDPVARKLSLAGGETLGYDRLVLAPGMDFDYGALPSLDAAAQQKVLHAWKAGPQTVALRRQLEAMPDGGVFVMHIPLAPYRCPPAAYERACLVARYLSTHKKRSKLIVLDANEDVLSEKALFVAAWNGPYKGYVDYRPRTALLDVDVATLTAKCEFEDVKADVLNVIPPQRAGAIARIAGIANANARFCQVDFLTYESTAQGNVHVVGDALQPASLMPRSGHMANQQAKVCACAVLALLRGGVVNSAPVLTGACYSYLSELEVAHIASTLRYDAAVRTMVVAAGGSAAADLEEAASAEAWARNIWADALA